MAAVAGSEAVCRKTGTPQAFHHERRVRVKKKSDPKKIVLKREVLLELNREETRGVLGGEYTYTCDSCACIW